MSANVLNTYQAVKTLREAGVGESQAEAMVNIMNDGIGDNLATRNDLRVLKQELTQDLRLLEQRLTIRLGGLMIAVSSPVVAAVKVL